MKVLVISGSPLYQVGNRYYGFDTWIRLPIGLAEKLDDVSLLTAVHPAPGGQPPANTWEVQLGKLKVIPCNLFNDFTAYMKGWLRQRNDWKRELAAHFDDHDLVLMRYPNPGLGLVSRVAEQMGKPLLLMINGNIKMLDRFIGHRGIKNIFYQAIAGMMVAHEVFWARKAKIIYAYSELLAKRHRKTAQKIILRMDPHLRDEDFVDRADTCQKRPIHLLRICWVIPLKGLECLIEAVHLLSERGLDVVLEIVGHARDENYKKQLEDLVLAKGLTGKIIFAGWVPFDKIGEAYLRADIQVISSLTEGFPRCIVEGSARGVPLVSTDCGGIPDVMTHEKNALLVPVENAPAMAKAIERMILDETLRGTIIKNGYTLAHQASFATLGLEFVEDMHAVLRESLVI